ncbi:MAG: carbohydrate ABC transporter permease [Candidatus Bipolaricaulia bacterium]
MNTKIPWYRRHIEWILLAPAGLVFLGLTVYPLIYEIVTSFYKIDIIGIQSFEGISNYIDAITNSLFQIAFLNTLYFVAGSVLLEFLFGLGLALLFNRAMRGRKVFRTIVLLPMMAPPVTVSLIWRMMYQYDFGVINNILNIVGLPSLQWLTSTRLAMPSLIIADVWQWTPFAFLVLLAGLQGIPEDVMEAAKVDGASTWQRFFYVTLPMIRYSIVIVLLLRTIDTFRLFTKVYNMTGGGPGNATETLTFNIYRSGFKFFHLGSAAAKAVIMVVIIVIISVFYIREILRRRRAGMA